MDSRSPALAYATKGNIKANLPREKAEFLARRAEDQLEADARSASNELLNQVNIRT